MRIMMAALAALASLLLCAAPAPAATPQTVLRLFVAEPDNAGMVVVSSAFKQRVEEASNGAIEVRVYHDSILGDDATAQFHRAQRGRETMVIGGITSVEPLCRRLGVVTLPYLFANLEQVVRGTTGEAGALLDAYAREAGLRVVAWNYSDWRHLTNGRRPITAMADMRGLRFRVPFSAVLIATIRAFGGIPCSFPSGMTRKAIEQGLVDGQCNGYGMAKGLALLEAGQSQLTEAHFTYRLDPLVISEAVFQKLSPEAQEMVLEAGEHASRASLAFQEQVSVVSKHDLRERGLAISQLTDEDAWKEKALAEVWPDVAQIVGGAEAINAYLDACGLPRWTPAGEETAAVPSADGEGGGASRGGAGAPR